MDLATELRGSVLVVSLPRIPLDAAFVGEFTRGLTALQAGSPKLVLDLHRVLFIDSAGVGALVAAANRARDAGGVVRLCHVPARLRAVLEVVRLDQLMEISATVDEAVAAFGA